MWPDMQFPADMVTLIEDILNEKFHFIVKWNSNALIIVTSYLIINQRCLDITYKFNSNNCYKK